MRPMHPATCSADYFTLGGPKIVLSVQASCHMYQQRVPMNAAEAFLAYFARTQGFDTTGLNVLVTDGASMAMEIIMLGVCGGAGEEERPSIDV